MIDLSYTRIDINDIKFCTISCTSMYSVEVFELANN